MYTSCIEIRGDGLLSLVNICHYSQIAGFIWKQFILCKLCFNKAGVFLMTISFERV